MDLGRFITSTERRRLAGRTERRGAQTGFPTWGAFAFGGVFVAAGAAITLVGTRVIRVDSSTVHAPWWLLTVMGVVFALAGLAVWGMAWRQHESEKRRVSASLRHPGEPALADYAWDPAGFAAPRWSRAAKALAGAGGLTLFLSIFNYWAFGIDGPWLVKAVTILFDLILVAVWWEAGVRLGRALKFGDSRLAFAHFPHRLGEPVRLHWHPATGIERALRGTFTLRCVEEWFERTGAGEHASASLVQEEIWSGVWHLDTLYLFTPGEVVDLHFEPPAGLPPTHLSADKPVFWEFEVNLDLPGLDFEEVYLVPVYAAP